MDDRRSTCLFISPASPAGAGRGKGQLVLEPGRHAHHAPSRKSGEAEAHLKQSAPETETLHWPRGQEVARPELVTLVSCYGRASTSKGQ